MVLTWILVRGVRESARANNWMVVIKLAAILLFIFGAARAVNTANWHPFLPNGFSGVLTGGAIVFFTYIGFDSVSTAAEECQQPQRNMPLGILITLAACAILYAGVALVLTGIAHWDTLNNAAPVANALKMLGDEQPQADRDHRRAGGDDFLAAGISIWAGAHLVRHVARPPSTGAFFTGASQVRHAARQHLDRRPGGRDSGRCLGHWHVRRPRQYRHAVRVHRGLGGRHRAAQDTARSPARVPRAWVAMATDGLHPLLPGADDGIASGDLGTILRLAVYRIRDLFPVRTQE